MLVRLRVLVFVLVLVHIHVLVLVLGLVLVLARSVVTWGGEYLHFAVVEERLSSVVKNIIENQLACAALKYDGFVCVCVRVFLEAARGPTYVHMLRDLAFQINTDRTVRVKCQPYLYQYIIVKCLRHEQQKEDGSIINTRITYGWF